MLTDLLPAIFRSRKLFVAIFGVVAIVFVIGYSVINYNHDCYLREATNPTIPLYPNSMPLAETTQYDSPSGKIINASFEIPQIADGVIRFYRDHAELCSGVFEGKVRCDGRAEPFGRYTVSINVLTAAPTTYLVETRWGKCGRGEGVSFDR